jgi:hypothetical protein
VRDELVEQLADIRRDQVFGVARAAEVGHLARERQLVVRAVFEAHAEGAHRLTGALAHERHDAARVDATRQEGAERHFRHQLARDGALQGFAHGVGGLVVFPGPHGNRRRVPVALDRDHAVAVTEP